jgi:hypothetical protein
MIQIKERKRKYRNAGNKRKAAFCGSSFLNSKTIGKSMNLAMNIIRRGEKNRTIFLEKFEKSEGFLRRRKYEYE